MPKNNPCSIFSHGRITNFRNVKLLAEHLNIQSEVAQRWRRELITSNETPVRYFKHVLIDFEPGQIK